MTKFMKYHKLSSSAFYIKVANIKPKNTSTVDERWKTLLTKLNSKYKFSGISAVLPDINRLKVKKIAVKDKGLL